MLTNVQIGAIGQSVNFDEVKKMAGDIIESRGPRDGDMKTTITILGILIVNTGQIEQLMDSLGTKRPLARCDVIQNNGYVTRIIVWLA